jgi:type III secretion protein C
MRLTIAGAMMVGATAHSSPVPWSDAPYSQFAKDKTLDSVLADFAGSFSLSLNISEGVSGLVNGRFTAQSPTEFLSKLASVYGFVWYTHAGTLFVSPSSEVKTTSISAPGGRIGGLRQALTQLGVLEPRFGWGELPEEGIALISGPPSYVQMVQATIDALPVETSAQQVAVFRLKHASAEDRSILFRGKEVITPGLATTLKNLISGNGATVGANSDALMAIAAPLRPQGTTELAQAEEGTRQDAPSASKGTGAQRARAPSVQADTRLNALVVQDLPARMPIYRQLIEQLDVPTALIEIEAMIIDVNTERAKDLGINWAGRDGRVGAGFGSLAVSPEAGTLSVARGPEGSAVSASSLIVDAGNYFISQIRLLESNGDAQIQSRPSVLTLDNVGAVIDLSETFYIRVQGERVANVTPITTGTSLRVTPRVVGEGEHQMVQLVIDIEDGQIQDRRIDALPTVRTSAVSTQAYMRPEDTLLIAGHSQDQNIEKVDKVPLLGDIPGLGMLFSNRAKNMQRRDRFFLIRPRIVSRPGMAPLGQDFQVPPRKVPAPITPLEQRTEPQPPTPAQEHDDPNAAYELDISNLH